MSYILYAWLTTFLYSASGLVGKYAAKHKMENQWLYCFVWSFVVVIVSCGASVYVGFGWPTDWTSIIIAGFLSALTALMYTFCMYMLDVSILSSLYTFRTPMSVILGALYFGESLTLLQIAMISVITIGGMFVSIDEHMSIRSFFTKSVLFALVMIFFSALYNASVKYAVENNPYWTTVFWYNLVNQGFLLFTIPYFWNDIRKINISDYTHVMYSAVLAGIGGITVISAIIGNLGITMAILTLPLTLIGTIIIARFSPKLLEYHPPKVYAVRLLSALTMFAAALGLSK